jgi:hypothetical protein
MMTESVPGAGSDRVPILATGEIRQDRDLVATAPGTDLVTHAIPNALCLIFMRHK